MANNKLHVERLFLNNLHLPIMFSVKAAFGVAFGVLYRALTLQAAGRSFGSSADPSADTGSADSTASADFCHGSLSCALGALSDTGSSVLLQYIPDILWLGKTIYLNIYLIQ